MWVNLSSKLKYKDQQALVKTDYHRMKVKTGFTTDSITAIYSKVLKLY